MRRLLLTAGLCLSLAMFASAAAPPAPPERSADQLDYVFQASDRPVLIRLHLRLGEKAYDAPWLAFMDRLFSWFDQDKNGFLDTSELARVPTPSSILELTQGRFAGSGESISLAALDGNRDGKVSRDELRSYYRNLGLRPLSFTFDNSEANNARRVNKSIYQRLDRNNDGKLDEQEIRHLARLLRSLDENEDELLTANELNTEGNDQVFNPFLVRRLGMAKTSNAAESGLIEIPSKEAAAVFTTPRLFSRYDRNRDGRLARAEVAFEASVFDELDRNRDGYLDRLEFAKFFAREPDLILRLQAGPAPTSPASQGGVAGFFSSLFGPRPPPAVSRAAEVVNEKRLAPTLTKQLRRLSNEMLSFALGDTSFVLHVQPGQIFIQSPLRGYYMQQFDNMKNKDGVVLRTPDKENRRAMPFFQIFNQADRDGDGKLTRTEMIGYLDLLDAGLSSQLNLQVNDSGRSLFNVLDGNRNGQLSLRETRTAWERMKPLCKQEKGLAEADLPRTMQITIGAGNVYYGPVQVAFYPSATAVTQPGPWGAPVWFRKMDRNNDGDLSPREWLGSEEVFQEMDADKDGLISPEEARKFEGKKAASR